MTNPWLEWWDDLTLWWSSWRTPAVLIQFVALGLVLILTFVLDRILERRQVRFLGDAPQEDRKMRTMFWAAKYPLLVLLFGGLALAVFSVAGLPARTLQRLISLFWFVVIFALVAEGFRVFMPPGDARRIVRKVLLPLLAIVGVLHLAGLLSVIWKWASRPLVTFAATRITLADIGLAVAIIIGFYVLARVGKALVLKAVLPRTHADPNLARSIAGFAQFVVIILGAWLALSTLGVEFSNLTLLLSALTVGIGFGLQDVIKNVTGGVILLSEGHVRPGEVFRIGGETGVVEQIGLRSTTIRTWDRSQVIVPNAYLISEKVSDLTGSQRVDIAVGVACDTDPRQVERLLLETAAAHPDVLEEPAPSVFFTKLGESTFDFALYCFVSERSKVAYTKSDLHYAIVETFRQHHIEMPYPQRDVHLRSGPWAQITHPQPGS